MIAEATKPTIDAFAMNVIKQKAHWIARKAGLRASDRDDVAQDLTLHLLKQLSKYDPQRAHINVFVTTVVDRQAKNLLRDCYAMKRDQRGRASLSDPADDGDGGLCALGETILEDERLNHRSRFEPPSFDKHVLALDVAAVLAELPEKLRTLANRLQHASPVEVAREMNLSRYEMDDALRQLREHFETAGFDGAF